jgi:hypothetical protein
LKSLQKQAIIDFAKFASLNLAVDKVIIVASGAAAGVAAIANWWWWRWWWWITSCPY